MKIKFGSFVVAGRGKIGGHVASQNRSGSYLRTKVTPTNPQSSAQSEVRSRLAALSQAWSGLTEAQRASWNSSVALYASTNIFGDIVNPSGFSLFQKLNNNRAIAGLAITTTCPAPQAVPAIELTSLTAAAGTPALSLGFGGQMTNTFVQVEATPQLPAGKNSVKSEYRIISVVEEPDSPLNLLAAYTARFGTLVAGKKVFVRCFVIHSTTGQASPGESISAIIAA